MFNSVTGAEIDSDPQSVTGDAQIVTIVFTYSAIRHLVQDGAWHKQRA